MEELIRSMEFMENFKQKFSDQQQQLEDAELRNAELSSDVEQQKKKVSEVQSQLEHAQVTIKNLQQIEVKLKITQNEKEQFQKENSQYKSQLEESENSKSKCQTSIDNLQAQLECQVTKCSQLETELEDAKNTIEGKEQKLVEYERIISEKQEAVQEVEEKSKKAVQEVEEKSKKAVQEVEEKSKKAVQEVEEKSKKAVQKVEEKLKRAQKCNAITVPKVISLEKEIREIKQEKTNIQVKYKRLREFVSSLNAEFLVFIEDLSASQQSGEDGQNEDDSSAQAKLQLLSTHVKNKFIAWAENQKTMKEELRKTQRVVTALSRFLDQCLSQKLQANKSANDSTSVPAAGENTTTVSYRDIARQSSLPEVNGNSPTNPSESSSTFVFNSLDYANWPSLLSSPADKGISSRGQKEKRNGLDSWKTRLLKRRKVVGRCNDCGKPFSSWDELQRHKRTVHTIQKSKKFLQRPVRVKTTGPLSPQNPVPALKLVFKKCQSQRSSNSSWKILSVSESQLPITPPASIINGDDNVVEEQFVTLPKTVVDRNSATTASTEVAIHKATISEQNETTTSVEPNISSTNAWTAQVSPKGPSIHKKSIESFTPQTSNVSSPQENVAVCTFEEVQESQGVDSVTLPETAVEISSTPTTTPEGPFGEATTTSEINGTAPSAEPNIPGTSAPTLTTSSKDLINQRPFTPVTGNRKHPRKNVAVGPAEGELIQKSHGVDLSKSYIGFYCICGKQLSTKYNRTMHIEYFTQEWKFQCEKCDKRFLCLSHLKNHYTYAHKLPKYLEQFVVGCSECGIMFKTRKEFILHRRDIHQALPFRKRREKISKNTNPKVSNSTPMTLPFIKQERIDKNEVPVGEVVKHGIDRKSKERRQEYYCKCNKKYSNGRALLNHIHYKNSPEMFFCPSCHHGFIGTSYLRRHMRSSHNMAYHLKGCRRCGSCFDTTDELKQHKIEEHKIKRIRKIEEVDLTLNSQNREETETSSISPEDEGNEDAQEDEHSTGESSGARHAEDTSRCTRGNFYCICGLKFSTKRTLNKHVIDCTGEKKFECNICDKRFLFNGQLHKHLVGAHNVTNLRSKGMFGCRDCGRLLKNLAVLRRHRRITHPEKNHAKSSHPSKSRLRVKSNVRHLQIISPPPPTLSPIGSIPISTPLSSPPTLVRINMEALEEPHSQTDNLSHSVDSLQEHQQNEFKQMKRKRKVKESDLTIGQHEHDDSFLHPLVSKKKVLRQSYPRATNNPTPPLQEANPAPTPQDNNSPQPLPQTDPSPPQREISPLRSSQVTNALPHLRITKSHIKLSSVPTAAEVLASQPSIVIQSFETMISSKVTTESSLHFHGIDVKKSGDENFCKCGTQFADSSSLRQHILYHVSNYKPTTKRTKLPPPLQQQPPAVVYRQPARNASAIIPTPRVTPVTGKVHKVIRLGNLPHMHMCECGDRFPSEDSLQQHVTAATVAASTTTNVQKEDRSTVCPGPKQLPFAFQRSEGILFARRTIQSASQSDQALASPPPPPAEPSIIVQTETEGYSSNHSVSHPPQLPSPSSSVTSTTTRIIRPPVIPSVIVQSEGTAPPPPQPSPTTSATPLRQQVKSNKSRSWDSPRKQRVQCKPNHGVDTTKLNHCLCGDNFNNKKELSIHLNWKTGKRKFLRTNPNPKNRNNNRKETTQHRSAKRFQRRKGTSSTVTSENTPPGSMTPGPSILMSVLRSKTANHNQAISTPYNPSIQQQDCPNIFRECNQSDEDMIVDAHLTLEGYESVVRHGVDTAKATIGHFCLCKQEFSKRRGLMSHVKYYSANRKCICKTCGRTFLKMALLRHHMLRVHRILYTAPMCKDCAETFPTNMDLYRHFRMVHNLGAQWTTQEMKYIPPSTPSHTSIRTPNHPSQESSQEVPVSIKIEKL